MLNRSKVQCKRSLIDWKEIYRNKDFPISLLVFNYSLLVVVYTLLFILHADSMEPKNRGCCLHELMCLE